MNEKIAAFRKTVLDNIETVRRSVCRRPEDAVRDRARRFSGTDDLSPMMVNWALSQILCYLRYLELREEVTPLDERDGAVPWARSA